MINNPNYPLRSLGYFILPLAVCLVLMRGVPLPNEKAVAPYNSLILALEFVHSADDVFDALDPLSDSEILALDKVNYYDFLFMLVYSWLLGTFIYQLGSSIAQRPVKSLAPIAIVIFLADLLENIMMLNITSLYLKGQSDFTPFSNFLPLFTWTKWALLAITFAGLGIVLIQRGSMSKVFSVFMFLPAILLALSVVDYYSWVNRFTSSIFLSFAILIIFALSFKTVVSIAPDKA